MNQEKKKKRNKRRQSNQPTHYRFPLTNLFETISVKHAAREKGAVLCSRHLGGFYFILFFFFFHGISNKAVGDVSSRPQLRRGRATTSTNQQDGVVDHTFWFVPSGGSAKVQQHGQHETTNGTRIYDSRLRSHSYLIIYTIPHNISKPRILIVKNHSLPTEHPLLRARGEMSIVSYLERTVRNWRPGRFSLRKFRVQALGQNLLKSGQLFR